MPKVVFSKTLTRAPWGSWPEARVVNNSAAREVSTLKQQAGKDIVIWGSISVAQSLMSEQLIDDYRLVICPVVLGSGRPLFRDEIDSWDMTLQDVKTFDRGAVLLKYAMALRGSNDRTRTRSDEIRRVAASVR
jgi:dihydrofolate reductase